MFWLIFSHNYDTNANTIRIFFLMRFYLFKTGMTANYKQLWRHTESEKTNDFNDKTIINSFL